MATQNTAMDNAALIKEVNARRTSTKNIPWATMHRLLWLSSLP